MAPSIGNHQTWVASSCGLSSGKGLGAVHQFLFNRRVELPRPLVTFHGGVEDGEAGASGVQPVYKEAGAEAGRAVEPYSAPGNCRLPGVNWHTLQTLQRYETVGRGLVYR